MSDKVTLTTAQRDKLIEQYVDIVVDQMDRKILEEFVTEQLQYNFRNDYTDEELKEEVNNYDDELYEELVDNVTSPSYVDSLLTSGTDYPPLVDTEATHDSEGC